jgi:signal transduction histidine kinase/DNA-binding response OmpR family regulator
MAGETVLVIDDRRDNVEFLSEYVLRPNGYRILTAQDGEEGLRLALEARPDLIIVDLVMPRRTGLEILEELWKRKADIPAILMTFHGSEETAVRAFRMGARDYIIKPFSVEEMVAALDRALAEARLRRERDQLLGKLLSTNKQLEQRIKELRILYSIGQSVTSLLDLEQVLNRIVEAAAYITGAEESSLLLVDEESGDLYMRAARGLGERHAQGFRIRVQDSIAGQVVQAGRPIMVGGTDQKDRFKVKTDYFVKALLNVPLKVGNSVIGVLAVNNRTTSRPFTNNDLYLLSALADYASVAIENAHLYHDLAISRDEVRRWGEELEAKVAERTKELQATQELLIRTEKLASLGQLSAGVARQINGPIQIILGYVRMLASKLHANDPLYNAFKSIEREAVRCQRIAQDLLDFAHRIPPTTYPTDVNAVLEAASQLVAQQISPADIEVNKGYDPNLPMVSADESQLQQAFAHIIRNAYEAMPEGGILRLFTRAIGKEVQVIIADSGVGITPEGMRHIFEPFYTTKHSSKAAGLGLAISYGIIERHGGTIEVESLVGLGTTVTIRLRVEPGGGEKRPVQTAPLPPPSPPSLPRREDREKRPAQTAHLPPLDTTAKY